MFVRECLAIERELGLEPGVQNIDDAPSRNWVIVGLLFLAGLFNYLDRVTLSAPLPVISLDLATGPAKKGLVLSAFFWSYASMQWPVGWCVDRLNLRWFYPCMFAAWSLYGWVVGKLEPPIRDELVARAIAI